MGEVLLKGYSLPTIKHKRRYAELPENCLAYLSWCSAATCLCHIASLSFSLSVFYVPHPAVSYRTHSVTLHLICKLNISERRCMGVCSCVFVCEVGRRGSGQSLRVIIFTMLLNTTREAFSGNMAAIQPGVIIQAHTQTYTDMKLHST